MWSYPSFFIFQSFLEYFAFSLDSGTLKGQHQTGLTGSLGVFCFAAAGGKPVTMTLGQVSTGATELTGLLATAK